MRHSIMIVDDEPANLRLLERVFRRDFNVISATSGDEALRLLEGHDVALIITDQRMPGMTGIELLKRTVSLRPHMIRIILTGYTDVSALVDAINCGHVYKYVEKPWNNEELRLTVRRALEHYDSERRFQALLENSSEAVALFDVEGNILYAGPSISRILGYTSKEFIGRRAYDLVHPDDRALLMKQFADLAQLKCSKISNTLHRFQHQDGSWRWMEGAFNNLLDEPGVQAILANYHDITARKQSEEALHRSEEQLRQSQKMESIGTLAGGVAHDFNNLLTIILINTQLALAKFEPGSTVHNRLLEVKETVDRASDLARQLLAFSRRQPLERKIINFNETVGGVVKMLQRIIGEHLELRLNTSTEVSSVFADPAQIQQVLMNLAVNARDAMPSGGQLTIETHNVDLNEDYCREHPIAKPGKYVQIVVSDNGVGMDAETKERIFEPFFTTKEVGKGTGLGLAIVYGIVKQHGGHIEVESELGRGTTFKVYLPVDEKAVEEVSGDLQPVLQGGTETILLAEDRENLRELARDVLVELGYEVMMAKDGAEAVEVYAANRDRIDLVLLDVVMPSMGGHEAYQKIRSLGSNIPHIFMTGYDEKIEQNLAVDPVGAALLYKPFSVEVLGRKVREVLDQAGGGLN